MAHSPGVSFKPGVAMCCEKKGNEYISFFRWLDIMQRSRRAHNDFSVEESRTFMWSIFSLPVLPFHTPLHPHTLLYALFFDTAAMSNEGFCLAVVLNK